MPNEDDPDEDMLRWWDELMEWAQEAGMPTIVVGFSYDFPADMPPPRTIDLITDHEKRFTQ